MLTPKTMAESERTDDAFDGETAEAPTLREYFALVFLNRLSAAGIVLVVVGVVSTRFFGASRTGLTIGGGLSFVGLVLFLLGYTYAQRRLTRETRWG